MNSASSLFSWLMNFNFCEYFGLASPNTPPWPLMKRRFLNRVGVMRSSTARSRRMKKSTLVCFASGDPRAVFRLAPPRSPSTRMTDLPIAARHRPKPAVREVLPLPPLPPPKAMIVVGRRIPVLMPRRISADSALASVTASRSSVLNSRLNSSTLLASTHCHWSSRNCQTRCEPVNLPRRAISSSSLDEKGPEGSPLLDASFNK